VTTLQDLTADLTAVIYTRKSTASDGKSTRDQERECREWCERNNIPVGEVFCDEGVSASRYGTKHRGAWAAVKAYLRPGHILVAWESSRTARDLGEHVNLRSLCDQQNIPVAYNGRVIDFTSGDDRCFAAMDAILAERESALLSERILRGVRGAAAMGAPHGRPPWGYRRKDTARPEWELDPAEAPRVREAVERVLAGESRKSVLGWLRSTEGYAPASQGALGRAILNPQIAGKRVHKGKIIDGTWPEIITEDQHRQLVASRQAMPLPPGPESRHLCTGIAKCGKCGKPARFKSNKSLYACPNGCTGRLAEVVDREVEKAVLRRLRNINPDDYSKESPEVASALRQIEQLEAELAKWKAGAMAGDVDYDVYVGREKAIKAQIKALRPRTAPVNRPDLLRPENWESGTLQERRTTVRALLDIKLLGQGRFDITPR
jgi:DNA invertase Pin-like site-specific DNA recombinase